MADYNFRQIESDWQRYWKEHKTYKVDIDHTRPKFYVLDMFPYPSGAGLHVGHPLGYIASDIYSRYKRLKGFNVLHPMGFDAFGLPAEQYAIQTGQHPAVTTENNIKRYKEQLGIIGFSYDWDREVITCDPKYYKWTQWVFIQLFKHWYNRKTNRAESIDSLVKEFEKNGNAAVDAATTESNVFTALQWNQSGEKKQQEILMNYRLAYHADTTVNWCPDLGTVLANDEVKDGFSVRGGHPVIQKVMKQWLLRVTAYTERLLEGLDTIEWSDSLKEMQRYWIGKSEGASVKFSLEGSDKVIEVFTTRPDTIFGSTFMVLAPEHVLVPEITTPEYHQEVLNYIEETRKRTERDRLSDVKHVTGCFTGAYAINPFSGEKMPVWIADYVLIQYGTGAIMAVPGHDGRDYAFASKFGLRIAEVVAGGDLSVEAYEPKSGKMVNSDFLNGMEVKDAIQKMINEITAKGIGEKQVNYRLRDAIFSRQRYWGEPFPVYYRDGIPYIMDENDLPLELPEIDKILPTETGEAPLARAKNWKTQSGDHVETHTMPGFAGSSGYYLRYMDPHNDAEYFSKESVNYWQDVDLYIGGTEHATGHLIYARFWNKFLYDIGLSVKEEPFRKLVNQGMIQGRSNLVYRIKGTNRFVSHNVRNDYDFTELHVDVNLVQNDILDQDAFRKWRPEFADAEFILEDGNYICGFQVEKMSKSMHNVVNPDDIIEKYGADTFRMYEMFLGPIEQHKPWNTDGIEGVARFLKKFLNLYYDQDGRYYLTDEAPSREELKLLHRQIKKVQEDIENLSFNTSVSAFMITTNELARLKCSRRSILEPMIILLSPFAPHLAEELWKLAGHSSSVTMASFPEFNPDLIKEDIIEYPVSINGKLRAKCCLPAGIAKEEAEKAVSAMDDVIKWTEGKKIQKVVFVPGRIINIVVEK